MATKTFVAKNGLTANTANVFMSQLATNLTPTAGGLILIADSSGKVGTRTEAQIKSDIEAGVVETVTAGNGLTGGGTSGTVTLNVEASQTQITALGTIGTGTWQGTAIANAYIGTGINATKLADGSVTNTELQYIGSLTSDAQTQIDNKAAKGFVTAMAMALG